MRNKNVFFFLIKGVLLQSFTVSMEQTIRPMWCSIIYSVDNWKTKNFQGARSCFREGS